MDRNRVWNVAFVSLLVLAIPALAIAGGVIEWPWNEDAATVAVVHDDGTETVVVVEVADTRAERYQGLSGREDLARGKGMLFVHNRERSLTYVMRKMNFGLDLVYIGSDRRIEAISHLPPPGPDENGNNIRYTARAKWILEVPRGYTNATGIEVGDRVRIDYGETTNGTG